MKFKSFTVLGLVVLSSLLSGCGKNYLAEKEYWKAEQVLKSISLSDLQSKGPQVLEAPIQAFESVLDKFPGTPKALDSLFAIAKLRTGQKNYQAARETYQKVLTNFSRNLEKIVEARNAIATLYEIEGKWPESESAFWELAENHPLSQKGAYAPVHIIIHYVKTKDAKGKEDAYLKASEFYRKTIKEVGPIQAVAALRNYQALADLSYGDWQKARSNWLSISDEFPKSPYSPIALLTAAEISWKRQDFGTAEATYLKFIEKYPDHTLSVKAHSQLGLLYQQNKKEFGTARQWFEKALAKIKPKNVEAIAETKLLISKTYMEENNWPKAEEILHELSTKYPDTSSGLQVPLFMAARQEELGSKEAANQILDEAVMNYIQLESATKNPQKINYLQRLQNTVYAQQQDWQKMIANFDKNFQNERSINKKGSWLFLKALVTENRIKDKNLAASMYADFQKQFPDHPLSKLAKQRHDQLISGTVQA